MKRTIKITVKQAADILEEFAREFAGIDFKSSDFYVGIAKEPEERAEWHRTEDLHFVKTESREMAGAVEEEMHKRGYDTGSRPDNGGKEESIYVYIYPITPYTRETSDQA